MSSPSPGYELVTVKSGAKSLRSLACGEVFHPVIGPMAEAESLHVGQQRLVERALATRGTFVIWDVGLGAAANAVAALNALHGLPEIKAEIHSFDQSREPIEFALRHAEELVYLAPYAAAVRELMSSGSTVVENVRWFLHSGDFREVVRDTELTSPHAIFHDPFSPTMNPDLWTLEMFRAMHQRLSLEAPCLLTNYTRSTAVRVTLLLAGFFVGHGMATGDKDETTIAANQRELLTSPLQIAWLKRVRSSTRSAPLRSGDPGGPISEEDWETLLKHPQFCAVGAGAG
jgi:tRNA U34 5-methylaminomethyl-2-thiouridine-forming methyltransferase MnmC